MNVAFRISQNASRSTSHKISHVLSGSTRSLSWTSNQASRASVARNTAAYTAIHSQYSNRHAGQWAKGFSTSAIVEEESSNNSGSTAGKVTDAIREREQEGGAGERRPQRDRKSNWDRPADREFEPSPTVFVGGIPFFATEEDVRRLFDASAPIEMIKFGKGRLTYNTPYAHVTFKTLEDAVAVVESAKQEPFYMEGRQIRVSYSQKRERAASQTLFFAGFNGGSLTALRNFLGEHAAAVDNAFFKEASKALEALNHLPGPDGALISLRFANNRSQEPGANAAYRERRRSNRNDGQSRRRE
ncbi:hypothetical protein MD484_g5733, partial [Candolleomyces efflorescens]